MAASTLGILAAAACGGRSTSGAAPRGPSVKPGTTLAPDRAYVLESWGAQPMDTSLTVTAGQARRAVLRYGPPDNTVFAEVLFPGNAFADSGRSVDVTIAPRPGLYGVTITGTAALQNPVTLTFKYPVHFAVPVGARERYGSAAAFERALALAHVNDNGSYTTLPSLRPASDNLAATLPVLGTYVVVAPR